MKTDDWVLMLATGAESVPRHAAERRYATAIVAGLIAAAVLMLSLLGVRPDLAEAVQLPMFWVKIGYVASLGVVSLLAVARLSRPGARLGKVPAALALVVVAMWALAAIVLVGAEPAQRPELVFGNSWQKCVPLIALLSVPAFVATLWAMHGLAPTRLRLAGATAGLLSGAVAALVYSLHCAELAAPFVGSWYLLGMLVPAAVGAVVGPRVLRW